MGSTIFMTVDEVAELLQVSKSKAYKLMQEMNRELSKQGYFTMRGRVNRKYFMKRIYGSDEERM